MASADILRAARARIEDPKHHTIGCLAETKDGHSCDPLSADAVSWCAFGALIASGKTPETDKLLREAARLHGSTIGGINDRAGHAAVLWMYDAAIAAAEAGAGR